MPAGMRRLMILLAVAALIGLDAAPAPAAGTPNPWLKRRVLNIAHQGGEDEFPSNTLYAFRKALGAGADMLELDVGVTKDDQVVVMHDTSVDRTTNGTGLISEMTLREIQRLGQEPVSLETPVGEEDDSFLGDFVEDPNATAPATAAARALLTEAIEEALDELNDRERQVVRLRFGLDDGQVRTLEEVGKEFGVTRERIRQIEAKALRKLKHPSRSRKMRSFLDQ